MSAPIGATHAINASIWERNRAVIDNEKARYDLVFCDGASGHVELKLWNLSATEAREEIANWSGPKHKLKAFAYKR
jgi:hypothetical protein